MARFERSRGRGSKDREDKPQRRESRGRGGFEEYSKSKRDSRGGRSFGREKRAPLEMTKVICSACKAECEVPFKPSSSKPVYCRDCFSKNDDRGRSGRDSRSSSNPGRDFDRDFDIINEKLNKIMKTLNIN